MHKKTSVKVDGFSPAVTVDVPPMKILFLGNANVGKTTFIEAYINRVRNFYRLQTFIGQDSYLGFTRYAFDMPRHGRNFSVWILDLPTGSTAEDREGQYPAQVDLVVLCFGIDDPNSLDNVLDFWLPEMARHYEDLLPRYHLLGLKKDLRDDPNTIEELARENKHPVVLEDVLPIHQNIRSFSREYLDCSTLRDPDHAIYCMDTLIDHVFCYRGLHLPI